MPFTAAQLTTDYTNANMGMTPSAAESLLIQAYAQQDANGAMTDAATLSAVLALSSNKTDVALATYQYFTGATPTLAGLSFLVHGGGNANDLSSAYYANFNQENRYYNFAINLATDPSSSASASFAAQYASLTLVQTIQAAYENIVGSANVGATQAAAAQAFFQSNIAYYQAVASQRAPNVNQDLATKAIIIGSILNEAVKADVGTYAKGIDQFIASLATTGTANTGNLLVNYPATAVGVNVTLTTNIDTLSLGNGNDTVTASQAQLSGLDNVNGGGGNNVFNFIDTAAITGVPASATVSNFQTVNVTSGTSVSLDATKFAGATNMTISSTGASTVTAAAATTNITATAVGGNSVTGGLNVTTVDTGGIDAVSGAAGAISVTDSLQAANNVTVDGGTSVNVSVTGSTGGAIKVGATTAPTGSVTVTESVSTGAATGATVAVTGGTAVTINDVAANKVNTTVTFGANTVTGKSTTTSVTVNETAAATAGTAVAGVVDSAVTITDVNGASATKAGTITSVTLGNVAGATITDNAMTTLSLSGTDGTVTITDGLTTPTVTSLALNLSNAKFALTDTNNEIATLNVSTNGTGSTMTAITDTGLKTLAVTGSTGGLTLGAALQASVTSLTVGGAASFTGDISTSGVTAFAPTSSGKITATINATTQSFAGGSGVDVITTATDSVKTVTGGSSGSNEIILNNTGTTFTGGHPANISGFQILGTQSASGGTFDLSKFTADTFSTIDVQALGAATVFTKVTAGTALNLSGAQTQAVTYQLSDANGATDQAAVSLGTASTAGVTGTAQLTLEDNVLAGIGTVVITSNSKAPASTTNSVNTIATLNDTGMTSLTFTGIADTTVTSLVDNTSSVTIANAGTGVNANLDTITGWTDNNLKSLTLSGAVALTLTDGLTTGVTVAGGSDNAAVTLNLTGAASGKADSITLGNGVDVVNSAAVGSTTLTLGNGNDNVTASSTGGWTITAGNGNDTINLASSTSLDTVAVGTGTDVIKTGAGGSAITVGASGAHNVTVTTLAGTNTESFGAHTGTDAVSVAAQGATPTAIITGLNSAATTTDTITFQGDALAAGAVSVLSTATINAYANAHALDATQFSTALAAAFDTAGNGGLGLAQHGIGEFSFQGNTYIVEQANVTGTAVGAADTVVELVGTVTVTAASTAAAGVLTLHG